jgi:hypothetical protein
MHVLGSNELIEDVFNRDLCIGCGACDEGYLETKDLLPQSIAQLTRAAGKKGARSENAVTQKTDQYRKRRTSGSENAA